jgi:ribosomal protein L11 methyltransferase
MWYLKIITSKEIALEIQKTINEEVLSLSCLEKEDKKHIWEVQVLCMVEKEANQIFYSLNPQIQKNVIWEIVPLEQKNWVEENRKSFPAIEIGNFYIYGTHLKDQTPPNKICLQLDASTAFV